MLIPLDEMIVDWNLEITGILHLGAHLGEEAQAYADAGITNVWWVEANPDLTPKLHRNLRGLGHEIIEALVTAESGVPYIFHVANNGQSSSVLEFGTHPEFSPETKFTHDLALHSSTVDDLVDKHGIRGVNFMNLDLQGAELMALKGARESLSDIDYIYTEVNKDEVYIDCAKIDELDEHLVNFRRVQTAWSGDHGWGDALYVRTDGKRK